MHCVLSSLFTHSHTYVSALTALGLPPILARRDGARLDYALHSFEPRLPGAKDVQRYCAGHGVPRVPLNRDPGAPASEGVRTPTDRLAACSQCEPPAVLP